MNSGGWQEKYENDDFSLNKIIGTQQYINYSRKEKKKEKTNLKKSNL